MDLEENFNDLFTIYSTLEPPPIQRPRIDPVTTNFNFPIHHNMVATVEESPDINQDQEEVYYPFSMQLEAPHFVSPETKPSNKKLQSIVQLARSFVGGNYNWGGKDPSKGFDCSGLIGYVYKQNGINIPMSTFELFKTGTEVSLDNAQIGDIICTPGSGRSGKHVKMISNIDSNGQIYTIEAKGSKYGIVEEPLTKTDNIITIRRVIDSNWDGNPSTYQSTINNFYDSNPYKFSVNPQKDDYISLRYKYIKELENPHNEGFDEKTQIWTPPTRKGFDPNGIGIGLDIKTNKKVKDFLEKHGRTKNPWLTHQEMLSLQNDSLAYLENVLDQHTKMMKLSNTKRAIAIGLLYHGYGPRLWNKDSKLHKAFFNGTEQDLINVVTEFYSNTFPTRSRSHANFWKNYELDH